MHIAAGAEEEQEIFQARAAAVVLRDHTSSVVTRRLLSPLR